jgi:uncharacterized coiled-coil protein SlyX
MELEHRVKALEERMGKQERFTEKLDDRLDEVEKDQTETKVYVKQIFSILEDLKISVRSGITKEDLFAFLNNQKSLELQAAEIERTAADRQAERDASAQDREAERSSNFKMFEGWSGLILAILGGTIFVMVGYFFGAK